MLTHQTHERQRREAVTRGKCERALVARKSWRCSLKSTCHQQSIWHPYLASTPDHTTKADTTRLPHAEKEGVFPRMPTPAEVFGERISTFSDLWRLDWHEAGGVGVRRRLKRDCYGSAQLQHTYLGFLDRTTSPTLPAAAAAVSKTADTEDVLPTSLVFSSESSQAEDNMLGGRRAQTLVGLDVEEVMAAKKGDGVVGDLKADHGAVGQSYACELVTCCGVLTGKLV